MNPRRRATGHDGPQQRPRFDRRAFLTAGLSAGALGTAALALAACGGGGNDGAGDAAAGLASSEPGTSAVADRDLVLQAAQLFAPGASIAAAHEQRIPFALVGDAGPLRGDDAPAQVQLVDEGGTVIGEEEVRARVAAHVHASEADSASAHQHPDGFRYYAPRIDIPRPGNHRLLIAAPEGRAELAVPVVDPSDVDLPIVGSAFPSLVTPTTEHSAGVDTLCTRTPACPFHDASVDAALGRGEPFAVLFATPAYCQTQFCGPVLDVLIEVAPMLRTMHVEVWANPAEVNGDIGDPAIRPAPALAELGLRFEPALFVVGADGMVRGRLDNLFDADELIDTLTAAS